ncbi:MAG: hypothetical protein M9894_19295 [Planctomycetes bacterium]|nr:hypothetical protein [Planctomycetota bacterium]
MRRAALLLALVLVGAAARAEERVHAPSGLAYEVVPPTGWDGEDPVEVLVLLHGSGDRLANFRRAMRVLVPGARRFLCVYVQSPEERGWPLTVVDGVAALASEVRAAHPGEGTLLLGYSAGGQAATACLFQRPDAFDGALITGAIAHRPPPDDPRVRARLLCWAVNPDDETFGGREAVERLRGWLAGAGYDEARWRIDLREAPGLGHRIDGAAVQRGLDWLRAGLAAAPATDDDRERVAQVERLLAGRDPSPDDLRALARPIVAAPGGEARDLLAAALAGTPRHRDPAVALTGIELLGRARVAAGAAALAAALPRLQRDPARQAAAARALGAVPTPEATRALLGVLRRKDGDLAPQVAAAEALARIGGRAEAPALIGELAAAERDGRGRLAAALEAALREVTGHELTGARVWRAWWEQVGRKER